MISKQLFTIVFFTAPLYFSGLSAHAQPNLLKQINDVNSPAVALAPLKFLASDELMGRSTMRPEIDIAARYISEEFRGMGLKEVQGTPDYFQSFKLNALTPSKTATFTVNTKSYTIGDELLGTLVGDVSLTAPIVYAGYGLEADLEKTDVRGKIVVANMGSNDSATHKSFGLAFGLTRTKAALLQQKGAVALIERFEQSDWSWDNLKKAFSANERIVQGESNPLPVLLINEGNARLPEPVQGQPVIGTLAVAGTRVRSIPAKNVMGWVEGTDPKLKNQFVVLTAHYDHLGVARQPKMEEGKMDSIYNGTRDNAIGTTAVIDAARYFSKYPAKRSVLFIAYAAEEVGELGSKYFAEHPAIPLRQLIYNLNIDNASYNDTTIVTVIGLGRTSADEDIKKASAAYGLTALPDPAPEQNLFDRSDNTQLAAKGIPAPTFSLGIKKFDETIENRYHQLSDEVGNFNLSYGMKYIRAFILAAKYIADKPTQPVWVKGDKYEPAWKNLYR